MRESPRVEHEPDTVGRSWRLDPSGFPLLRVPGEQVFAGLWPITLVQIERFMAAAGSLPGVDRRALYRVLCPTSRRPSFGSAAAIQRAGDGVFATGILGDEAEAYLDWLTSLEQRGRYRLPAASPANELSALEAALAGTEPKRMSGALSSLYGADQSRADQSRADPRALRLAEARCACAPGDAVRWAALTGSVGQWTKGALAFWGTPARGYPGGAQRLHELTPAGVGRRWPGVGFRVIWDPDAWEVDR